MWIFDHLSEITQVATACGALGAMVLSFLNRNKIQNVHLSLNSRLTQLLEATRQAAHNDGIEFERQREIDRAAPK